MRLDRILLRLPNWLGDLLMSRPALHAVARAHPEAERRAIAPPSLAVLVAWDGASTSVRPWPAARERGVLAGELRRWRPDAAIVFPPSFSSAWWALRAGARMRIGYRHEARGLLLTHALRRPPRGDRHLAGEYLELARVLGASGPHAPPVLEVPASVRERARAFARDLAGAESFAILGPGAIYGPAKRWRPDRFAEVGRRLAGRGIVPFVCGAASDREVCAAVAAAIGPPARALAGETDLEMQAGLCAEARLAVCNDSGLAHLAAATGTPTVAVFGSTSSAWTAPLGPRVAVVQHAPVCAPCFQRHCTIGTICLEAVGVAEVVAACDRVLAA